MPNRSLINVQGKYYQLRADSKSVFRDEADYRFFISLLGQYILVNGSVEALAYCLAPDHFLLLLNQINDDGITTLMHKIIITYNKYYSGKYGVDDLLSESNYKVSKISEDELLDVSCKIHTQSDDWADCEYSSIRAYFYDDVPAWLTKKHIAQQYVSAVNYKKLLTAI